MHVVVVLHRPLVLVVNLGEILHELMEVHNLKEVVLLEDSCGHKRHLHVPANFTREFKDVEVPAGDPIIVFLVFLDHRFNVFTLEVEINPIRVDLDCSEVIIAFKCFLLTLTFRLHSRVVKRLHSLLKIILIKY